MSFTCNELREIIKEYKYTVFIDKDIENKLSFYENKLLETCKQIKDFIK